MDPDQNRKTRAAARAAWPVQAHRLGEEPPEAATTAEERLAMVWPITVDTWSISGRTIPDYPRSEMPVRVLRLGELET